MKNLLIAKINCIFLAGYSVCSPPPLIMSPILYLSEYYIRHVRQYLYRLGSVPSTGRISKKKSMVVRRRSSKGNLRKHLHYNFSETVVVFRPGRARDDSFVSVLRRPSVAPVTSGT